jgi:hypothetical protein
MIWWMAMTDVGGAAEHVGCTLNVGLASARPLYTVDVYRN